MKRTRCAMRFARARGTAGRERLAQAAPIVDAARDRGDGVVHGGRRQLPRRELSQEHGRQGAAGSRATSPPSSAPAISSMSKPSLLDARVEVEQRLGDRDDWIDEDREHRRSRSPARSDSRGTTAAICTPEGEHPVDERGESDRVDDVALASLRERRGAREGAARPLAPRARSRGVTANQRAMTYSAPKRKENSPRNMPM